MTSTDPWCVTLYWILTAGMGAAVQRVMVWLLQELREGFWFIPAGEIASRTKRRMTYVVTALLPTAVYLAYVWWGCEAYALQSHATFLFGAFTVGQAIHGETRLAKVPTVEVAIEPPHEIQEPT